MLGPLPKWKVQSIPTQRSLITRFRLFLLYVISRLPGGSDGKESACNVGDLGSILGLGRSPGEGRGNLLPENPGGSWESPQTEETGGLQSMGSQRARHSSKHTHMYHFKHVQHFYYLLNGFQFGFKSSFMWVHESDENESYSVMSDSLWFHGLNSPDQNTGSG